MFSIYYKLPKCLGNFNMLVPRLLLALINHPKEIFGQNILNLGSENVTAFVFLPNHALFMLSYFPFLKSNLIFCLKAFITIHYYYLFWKVALQEWSTDAQKFLSPNSGGL